jgi:hypothetical protein
MWRHGCECRVSADYVGPVLDRDHFESRVFDCDACPPSYGRRCTEHRRRAGVVRLDTFSMSRMAGPLMKFLLPLP